MAFTEFYIQTTGDNLNAGSTTADAAVYTSTAGNFDGTSVFTPTDGSTPANSVNVGDYVALYNTADTVCRCVAQVTAVGAGANGTITVSTTIKYGTVPTSNSGSRALKAGGAWASLAIAAANAPFNSGTAPQSTRVNIKAGTYTNTTTSRTLGLGGTTLIPVWWRGYKTTPGDQDSNNVAVAGTDIPSITFTTGLFTSNGQYQIFSNVDFQSAAVTASNGAVNISGNFTRLYGARVTNTAANANGVALRHAASYVTSTRCVFTATTSANAFVSAGVPTFLYGCRIVGGLAGIALGAATGFVVQDTVLDTQASDAITMSTGWGTFIGVSIYSPTGNGINITGTPTGQVTVANCYFSTVNQASKAAINNTSGTNTGLITPIANAYFNCTTNVSGITETFTIFDNGTLASEGFVNPTNHDFTMGGVGKALGFPGLFENTNVYRGYLDVGAVQGGGGPTGQIMRVTGQTVVVGN